MFFDPDEGHHFFRRWLRTILAVLVDRHGVEMPGRGLATSVAGARALASRKGHGR